MGNSLAELDTTALDRAAAPAAERPLPGLRAWFAAVVLWMVGLAVLALLMFQGYEQGDARAMGVWLLALMCFYLSLCNVFVPLPSAWIILLVASPGVGLFESAWLRVVAVAGVATVATVVANLNEYHVLAFLFRSGLGRRIRGMRVYQWAVRWFDVAPFQTLTLIGFVPIPIDAVRWLAVLRHYSRVRFAAAWFSVLMQLEAWEILAIQAAILVLALSSRLLYRPGRRRRLPVDERPADLPSAPVEEPVHS